MNRIQQLCLPKDAFIPDAVYFRGNATVTNGNLVIPEGERVTFDTYFNIFPLFKWRRYTRIADLHISVRLQGNARIELKGINRSKDEAGEFDDPVTLNSVVCQNPCGGDATLLQCGNLDGLADFLYLSIHAESEVVVESVTFATSAERTQDLNIACCFCTYKREADIKKNVENLLGGIVHNAGSDLKDRLHIYVADNGRTLPLDLYKAEPVHLFYNKNYGGSGGFTRCMIEACFRNGGKPFSHIILMDDDALILPEVVERTGALLSILKDEYRDYMIGGGLMTKENPVIQVEIGVLLSIDRLTHKECGRNRNISSLKSVLANETSPEADINYNGWWYCCIPAGVIAKDNLPLPFFLHFDDQEYGYRHGKFIRLNGIAAWHPRPNGVEIKRPHIVYYNIRNRWIAQAKYFPGKSAKEKAITSFTASFALVLNYKYKAAYYVSLSIRDFYKGIEPFKNLEPEQFNSRLMKGSSEELCQLSGDELKKIRIVAYKEEASAPKAGTKRRILKLLNWLVPAYKGRIILGDDLNWEEVNMFGVKEICLVDPETGKGVIFRKSYRQMFKALGMAISDAIMVARRHKRVFKEWHEGIPELTSYAFWQKYLGMETEKQANINEETASAIDKPLIDSKITLEGVGKLSVRVKSEEFIMLGALQERRVAA